MEDLTDQRILWRRALESLASAQAETAGPEKANFAYHAAYYAVAAFFRLEDLTFNTHKEAEAAVHSKLVEKGRWPWHLGEAYRNLHKLRMVCDMGCYRVVPDDKAEYALTSSRAIVEKVAEDRPDMFSMEVPACQ